MKDLFHEMHALSAETASAALSKLTGRSVNLKIYNPNLKKVEEIGSILDPEEMAVGIYLPLTGDVKGASFLIFPLESAFKLSDLLVKRKPGTTRKLTELDISALKEVGNILSGNYLTVLTKKLQVRIMEHIPYFSSDMYGAILSQVQARLAMDFDEAICSEVQLNFESIKVSGHMIVLLREEEIRAILEGLSSSFTNRG